MVSKLGDEGISCPEFKPARNCPELSHLQGQNEKVNGVINNLNFPNKKEGVSLKGLPGFLFVVVQIGQEIKRNLDTHLKHESCKPDGTVTINLDRNRMGWLEWLCFRPIGQTTLEINGNKIEVTYYPRIRRKAVAQITGGPKELVGLTVENLNCRQPDWKDQANRLLQDKVSQHLNSKLSHIQMPDQKTLPQKDPVKPSEPNNAKTPLDIICRDKIQNPEIQKIDDKIAQTRENNDQRVNEKLPKLQDQQALFPADSELPPNDLPAAKNPLDLIDWKDKTQNQQLQEIDDKIAQARENRDKVLADSDANQNQLQEAHQQVSSAFEEKLNKVGELMPSDESIKDAAVSQLEKLATQAKKAADFGEKHLEMAKEIGKQGNHHENQASRLQAKLDKNPNATEIKLKFADGTEKVVPRGKIEKKIHSHKQKKLTLEKKQFQHHSEGIKKAPVNRAIESAANETIHQINNIGNTLKGGGLSNGADALMDVIEGKSDVPNAICNAAINTATSTAVQVGGSIIYEGIKGGIKAISPKIAEQIPGLGGTLTLINLGYVYETSITSKKGLQKVGEISVNMGGEFTTTAVITAGIAAVGVTVPALYIGIGGKLAWRVMKYGINRVFETRPELAHQ